MRALVCKQYGTADQLVIEDRADPAPSKGQILVEVRAAGLNFPDLLSIAGKYQVRVPPPFVPGFEAAGVVSAVGEGARRFSVGDRVMITPGIGAFAEKCAVDETMAQPLPDGLSFEQGAGFTITYATSYHAFRQCAPLEAGATVLVLGAAGGVGTTAVEIAKAMGARVIAAASSDAKLAFARESGADEVVDYTSTSLKEAVKELTDGAGVDVVYDPVGGEAAREALRLLAWGGRYLVVGFASGDIPEFPANLVLLREASIIGVYWGGWAQKNPGLAASNMKDLGEMVARGALQPRVTGAYPLDRFAEAFAALAGRRVRGKLVLTFQTAEQ